MAKLGHLLLKRGKTAVAGSPDDPDLGRVQLGPVDPGVRHRLVHRHQRVLGERVVAPGLGLVEQRVDIKIL